MRSPRKLAGQEQLYAAALRALMRRAHSVHEMRIYLERRSDEEDAVRHVLSRLKADHMLDDARYARQFTRDHAENRGQGRYRIARELRARGVPDRHIEPALDEFFAEIDETDILRQRLVRRLRHLSGPLDQRKLASLYRSLLRAGFSADAIRQQVRELTKVDATEPPEDLHEDV